MVRTLADIFKAASPGDVIDCAGMEIAPDSVRGPFAFDPPITLRDATLTNLLLRDVTGVIFERPSMVVTAYPGNSVNCRDIAFVDGHMWESGEVANSRGIQFRESERIRFTGMIVEGFQYGIIFWRVHDPVVEDCAFSGARTDMLRFQDCVRFRASGNRFRNAAATLSHPDAMQIWQETVSNEWGIIEDNWIERGSGGMMQGIFTEKKAAGPALEGFVVRRNVILGSNHNAIVVHGDAEVTDNLVIGYTPEDGKKFNVWIGLSADHSGRIEGNEATGFTIRGKAGLSEIAGNRTIPQMPPEEARAYAQAWVKRFEPPPPPAAADHPLVVIAARLEEQAAELRAIAARQSAAA